MNIMTNFAETLKELMTDNQLKSEKLAKLIGTSGGSIRRWCEGALSINLTNLLKLTDFFKCSIDYLVGRSEIYLSYIPQPYLSFYDNLKNILTLNGMTMYAFQKQTRYKENFCHQWKRGSSPTLSTLTDLANIFDCSIDYLIGIEQ